tara:strand:- start:85 stop:585 length:501 start_codon:yes stop_codon:yes gene_type:complete
MKNINKIILSAFVAFLLFSCGVTKKTTGSDQSEGKKTIEERFVTRPGDTITINIPNIRYKDTTITRTNYENRTIASVRYDDRGNQTIECLTAETKEYFKTIREEFKNDIKNDEEIEREFKPQNFIYAIAVLVGVLVIAMIIGVVAINKVKKAIPEMIHDSLNTKNY